MQGIAGGWFWSDWIAGWEVALLLSKVRRLLGWPSWWERLWLCWRSESGSSQGLAVRGLACPLCFSLWPGVFP